MTTQLILGDCLEEIKNLEDNSIDSIVTDPPYGLAFMGKKWDYDVPSVDIWSECLRVLKPGGHLLSFSSARTYHRMVVNVEDAGFEIRDQIMWVYGQGFPKSHNLGDGWGTALKPAHEPIVLARKPIQCGTVKANRAKHGTGGLNIEASRVPASEPITINTFDNGAKPFGGAVGEPFTSRQSEGRFPANFIHDGLQGEPWSRYFYCPKVSKKERDQGLTCEETPYVFFQTANGTSGKPGSISAGRNTAYKNTHPTVKPKALMSYLLRLVTPACGVVLDPFMGSGSTGVAALEEGFSFIGIEKEEDYHDLATKRIKHTSAC